jgi:ribonuclease HII
MSPRRPSPSLRLERALLRVHGNLVAVDEVGRGALAGPVLVGAVLLRRPVAPFPPGLRDSKLLSPSTRQRLVPEISSWVADSAVGAASPQEIDDHGILAALRLAALRAFATLPVAPSVVLLDGPLDWITPEPADPSFSYRALTGHRRIPPLRTRVGGDRSCASLAAASVLAKVERDALMDVLAVRHPGYGWERNKGYASAVHQDGLRALGPCSEHRRSWRLPGQHC